MFLIECILLYTYELSYKLGVPEKKVPQWEGWTIFLGHLSIDNTTVRNKFCFFLRKKWDISQIVVCLKIMSIFLTLPSSYLPYLVNNYLLVSQNMTYLL